MNFELNEQQLQVQSMVRDFAEKELRPIARETDLNHRFPKEQIAKLGQLGLMGVTNSPQRAFGIAPGDIQLIRSLEKRQKVVTVLFHPLRKLWVLDHSPKLTWPPILGHFTLKSV